MPSEVVPPGLVNMCIGERYRNPAIGPIEELLPWSARSTFFWPGEATGRWLDAQVDLSIMSWRVGLYIVLVQHYRMVSEVSLHNI